MWLALVAFTGLLYCIVPLPLFSPILPSKWWEGQTGVSSLIFWLHSMRLHENGYPRYNHSCLLACFRPPPPFISFCRGGDSKCPTSSGEVMEVPPHHRVSLGEYFVS